MAGVETVLHAAMLHKPDVQTYPCDAFIETNVLGTLILLDEAVNAGVKSFVYTSMRADDLERLPSVQAFDGGKLVAVLFDQAGDLEQILFAVLGFAVAPLLKRRVSRLGRAIDVFSMAAPSASEHAVGGRIERFEMFRRARLRSNVR